MGLLGEKKKMNREQWVSYAIEHPGSQASWCSGCEVVFSSPFAFDKHRVRGNCLSEAEMRERGMDINARGLWVSEKQPVPISAG